MAAQEIGRYAGCTRVVSTSTSIDKVPTQPRWLLLELNELLEYIYTSISAS
jgi:hypothetical protein